MGKLEKMSAISVTFALLLLIGLGESASILLGSSLGRSESSPATSGFNGIDNDFSTDHEHATLLTENWKPRFITLPYLRRLRTRIRRETDQSLDVSGQDQANNTVDPTDLKNAPQTNPVEVFQRLTRLLDRMLRELSQYGQRFTLRLIRMTERQDIDQMQDIMKDFEISAQKPIFFIAGGLRLPNGTSTKLSIPEMLSTSESDLVETTSLPLVVSENGETEVPLPKRQKRAAPKVDEFNFFPIFGRSARTENPYDEEIDELEVFGDKDDEIKSSEEEDEMSETDTYPRKGPLVSKDVHFAPVDIKDRIVPVQLETLSKIEKVIPEVNQDIVSEAASPASPIPPTVSESIPVIPNLRPENRLIESTNVPEQLLIVTQENAAKVQPLLNLEPVPKIPGTIKDSLIPINLPDPDPVPFPKVKPESVVNADSIKIVPEIKPEIVIAAPVVIKDDVKIDQEAIPSEPVLKVVAEVAPVLSESILVPLGSLEVAPEIVRVAPVPEPEVPVKVVHPVAQAQDILVDDTKLPLKPEPLVAEIAPIALGNPVQPEVVQVTPIIPTAVPSVLKLVPEFVDVVPVPIQPSLEISKRTPEEVVESIAPSEMLENKIVEPILPAVSITPEPVPEIVKVSSESPLPQVSPVSPVEPKEIVPTVPIDDTPPVTPVMAPTVVESSIIVPKEKIPESVDSSLVDSVKEVVATKISPIPDSPLSPVTVESTSASPVEIVEPLILKVAKPALVQDVTPIEDPLEAIIKPLTVESVAAPVSLESIPIDEISSNLPSSTNIDPHFGVKPIETVPVSHMPGLKPSIPARPHPDYLDFIVQGVDTSNSFYFMPSPQPVIITSPPVYNGYTSPAAMIQRQQLMQSYFPPMLFQRALQI